MSIDTLLQLFSSSFNIFKKNIRSMAPLIILYSIGIITLIFYFPAIIISNDIFIITLFTFLQVLYKIFIIKYIFIHISDILPSIKIHQSSQHNILGIDEIIRVSLSIFLLDMCINMIGLLDNFSIFHKFSSILFLLSIIITCLFLFVPYIMLDKKETLKNSVIYSCVLALNNIGSILLFGVAFILLGVLFLFLITIIFSIGQSNFSVLLSSIVGSAFYYFILIWFSLFYLKLSNSE